MVSTVYALCFVHLYRIIDSFVGHINNQWITDEDSLIEICKRLCAKGFPPRRWKQWEEANADLYIAPLYDPNTPHRQPSRLSFGELRLPITSHSLITDQDLFGKPNAKSKLWRLALVIEEQPPYAESSSSEEEVPRPRKKQKKFRGVVKEGLEEETIKVSYSLIGKGIS